MADMQTETTGGWTRLRADALRTRHRAVARPTRLRALSGLAVLLCACGGGASNSAAPTTDALVTTDAVGADGGDAAGADVGYAALPDASVPPSEPICARASVDLATTTVTPGDVNGDGIADIADVAALDNAVFRGGPAPICPAASDFVADGAVDFDDVTALNAALVTGLQTAPALAAGACADALAWADAPCIPLGLSLAAVDGPDSRNGAVEVRLTTGTADIQALSFSLRAVGDGCALAGVDVAGTFVASVWDTPPGREHLGYSFHQLLTSGAAAWTLLSLTEDVSLGPADSPAAVLRATVAAPASGCVVCQVTTDAALSAGGGGIQAVAVSDGRAYDLPVATVWVRTCAP